MAGDGPIQALVCSPSGLRSLVASTRRVHGVRFLCSPIADRISAFFEEGLIGNNRKIQGDFASAGIIERKATFRGVMPRLGGSDATVSSECYHALAAELPRRQLVRVK